ncbi:hypothetical protein CRYUN_Cryun09bG0207200 [Craigia yunnanensis]
MSFLALQTEGKWGSTRSLIREKLYKSSIQKAKETLRIKRMKTGLADKIVEKRVMAESLKATKTAETQAESSLLIRRNELVDELNSAINDFVILREMENLLMGFL